MEIILGFVLGVFVAWLALQYLAWRILQRFEHTVQEALTRVEPTPNVIQGRAEQVGDMFYIYDDHNGGFLAQGTNCDEIMQHLKSRHDLQNTTVVVNQGEQDVLERLRTQGC